MLILYIFFHYLSKQITFIIKYIWKEYSYSLRKKRTFQNGRQSIKCSNVKTNNGQNDFSMQKDR